MPKLSAFEHRPITITSLTDVEKKHHTFDVYSDLNPKVLEHAKEIYEDTKDIWADVDGPYEVFLGIVFYLKLLFPESNWTESVTQNQMRFIKTYFLNDFQLENSEYTFGQIKILFPQLKGLFDKDRIAERLREMEESNGTMKDADSTWGGTWNDYAYELIDQIILDPSFGTGPISQEAKGYLLQAIAHFRKEKFAYTFVPTMVAAKLVFGETFALTPAEWELARKELEQEYDKGTKENCFNYLKFAFWLKVLAAESVKVTDEGIEFVMKNEKPVVSPPPVRRQF